MECMRCHQPLQAGEAHFCTECGSEKGVVCATCRHYINEDNYEARHKPIKHQLVWNRRLFG